jgi:mono/diheme cytochrome c family protein
MKRAPFLTLVLIGFIIGLSCQKRPEAKKVDFVTQIKPILEARCINCHNSGALFGELNLENRELAYKNRAKGPVIIPGEAGKSPFFTVLTLPEGDRKAMPPTGHRIAPSETELIRQWISQGAVWPDGADGAIKPKIADHPAGVSS